MLAEYMQKNNSVRVEECSYLNNLKEINIIPSEYCNTFFFSKKKLLACHVLEIGKLVEYQHLFKASNMVVLNIDHEKRSQLRKKISELCDLWKSYGPVVEVGQNDMFVFPKLNYGDIYLIKDIFNRKFVNEKISVILGGMVI